MGSKKSDRERVIDQVGRQAHEAITELVLLWKTGAYRSPAVNSDAWGRLHRAELDLLDLAKRDPRQAA